jgi:methionyl-tRNA formyltransferase
MLPEIVWAMPPLGTFNLHGSLLPKYRGAAPINWAVIRGEQETGLTTFFLQQAIDTGDLLFQERTPIEPNDTAGDLHDRLMYIGAALVLKTVRAIEREEAHPRPQDDALACPAPKLFKDNTRIDFSQPVHRVHDFIRGLSPFPGAWTELDGQQWKLLRTTCQATHHDHAPGQLLTDGHQYLRVACPDGWVDVRELQLQGKRRMTVSDFLNGWRPAEGEVQIFQ